MIVARYLGHSYANVWEERQPSGVKNPTSTPLQDARTCMHCMQYMHTVARPRSTSLHRITITMNLVISIRVCEEANIICVACSHTPLMDESAPQSNYPGQDLHLFHTGTNTHAHSHAYTCTNLRVACHKSHSAAHTLINTHTHTHTHTFSFPENRQGWHWSCVRGCTRVPWTPRYTPRRTT